MMNYDDEIKEYILDYYGEVEEEEMERIKDDLFIIEAQDDEELGEKYIDICGGLEYLDRETLERFFDFDAYGRELSFSFTQTDNLYISNN